MQPIRCYAAPRSTPTASDELVVGDEVQPIQHGEREAIGDARGGPRSARLGRLPKQRRHSPHKAPRCGNSAVGRPQPDPVPPVSTIMSDQASTWPACRPNW